MGYGIRVKLTYLPCLRLLCSVAIAWSLFCTRTYFIMLCDLSSMKINPWSLWQDFSDTRDSRKHPEKACIYFVSSILWNLVMSSSLERKHQSGRKHDFFSSFIDEIIDFILTWNKSSVFFGLGQLHQGLSHTHPHTHRTFNTFLMEQSGGSRWTCIENHAGTRRDWVVDTVGICGNRCMSEWWWWWWWWWELSNRAVVDSTLNPQPSILNP